MAKDPTLVSPAGTQGYSHLDKPDSGREYSDDKYKVDIRWPKSGAENQEQIDAFGEQVRKLHEEAGGEPDMCPFKDGDAMKKVKNKDTGKIEKVLAKPYNEGHWFMTSKSTKRPGVIDASKAQVPNTLAAAGDTIRIVFDAHAYAAGKNFGMTPRLITVQVLEKADHAAANAAKAAAILDDAQGYVASEEEIDNEVDGASGDY